MKKYRVSKKVYLVSSPEELLEQIKNESSHTRELPLQEYMDNVAARVINGMTDHKIPTPANAQAIIDVWKQIDVLEEIS